MKRRIVFFFAFVMLCFGSVSAQKYFVYDGESFNIMIVCTDDNATITGVEYSFQGKWVPFTINEKTEVDELDDWDGEGGYIFKVTDANGNSFTIDYYRYSDYCVVTNAAGTTNWTMNRRAENK